MFTPNVSLIRRNYVDERGYFVAYVWVPRGERMHDGVGSDFGIHADLAGSHLSFLKP